MPLLLEGSNVGRSDAPPLPAAVGHRGAHKTCFIVKDMNGQRLAYVYYENEPGRRTAANLLMRDEARRIAANIAKLPELLNARAKP
jgi:hypothetical protein